MSPQAWEHTKLTTKFAKAAPAPTSGQAFYFDTEIRELALRVLPGGGRSWIVNITHNGKLYRRTLEPLARCTAEQARAKAQIAIGKIKNGIDPLEEKREQKRAREESERAKHLAAQARQDTQQHTLRRLCELYVADLERRGKSASRDAASLFRVHVYGRPEAGRPAREQTSGDIAIVLRRVVDAGKGRTAAKLRSYLRAAYQRAAGARHDPTASADLMALGIDSNPVTVTGSLADFNRVDERNLTDHELAFTLRSLSKDASLPARVAWANVLLGGQRPAQLLRAKVVNFDGKLLTIYDPKGRRKQPREHVIPVIGEAAEILRGFAKEAQERGSKLLFSTHGKIALRTETVNNAVVEISKTMAAEAKKAKKPFEPFSLKHLRSAVETQLAKLGVSEQVRAQLLSHGLGGVQARHYNKHDYLNEKKEALELWHGRIAQLLKGARKAPARAAAEEAAA